MQLIRLLHKVFEKELPFIYKTRRQNVFDASKTIIDPFILLFPLTHKTMEA